MLPAGICRSIGGEDMVFRRMPQNPVRYDLCNQTVTVYHKEDGKEAYTRKVYARAFLDRKKTQSVDKTGSRDANSFLLVIPGSEQTVYVGDKVYEGLGPEISTADEWRNFIPSKVPELVVVSYADPKRWDGSIVHTEAGG